MVLLLHHDSYIVSSVLSVSSVISVSNYMILLHYLVILIVISVSSVAYNSRL